MAKPRKPNKDRKPNRPPNRAQRIRSEKEVRSNPEKEAIHKPVDIENMRLNKYVAHCGICSRRQAAEHVKAGKVTVNGEVHIDPSYQVQNGDVITFEGNVITPEKQLVYILLNKPKNTITTLKDEKGRPTVMDLFEGKINERIFPVGRLDRATTGLLLLTNDGDLAQKLAHPKHKVEKVYQVMLDKEVSDTHLEQIKNGLKLEDGMALVDWVKHLEKRDKNEVAIALHIGKNRIVRRIFEHLGYTVKRLDRVVYAGLTKRDLPRGFFRHLTEKEVIMLRHFV